MRKVDIGNYSFEELVSKNNFYIDKTLFIKDYIESSSKVTLITRPRRFGKSINLDMLEHFLDISLNSSGLFEGLNISNYSEFMEQHLNKYPVIYLDLKDLDGLTSDKFREKFYYKVRSMYVKYKSFITGEAIATSDKDAYDDIFNNINEAVATDSLRLLVELLSKSHGVNPIVLIDEYDMPLEKAYANGYYKDAISLIGVFLSSALKGNKYLNKALLIGCSKVAQAGIFSGLNNLTVHSINNDSKFNTYFGFTEDEIKESLKEYNLEETFADVKYWYDGYDFNGKTIYNPWSVTNYLDKKKFDYYWVNTGSLRHIRESLYGIKNYKKLFISLIQDEKVVGLYSDFISYSKGKLSKNDILSLLYQAGYLKMIDDNEYLAVNYEAKESLKVEFIEMLEENADIPDGYIEFFINLTKLNIPAAISNYEEILNDTLFSDHESSHHALLMVASHSIKGTYTASREQSNAAGRSDLVLKSIDKSTGFVIEVKRAGVDAKETLDDLIVDALQQINSRNYASVLAREGYAKIHHVAIAIKGANVSIKFEQKDYPEYNQMKDYLVYI